AAPRRCPCRSTRRRAPWRASESPARRLPCGRRRLRLLRDGSEIAERRRGGALAGKGGAGDRAPKRLVRGFAGEKDAVGDRLDQRAAARRRAGRGGRKAALHERLAAPAHELDLAERRLGAAAETLDERVGEIGGHRALPGAAELAAEPGRQVCVGDVAAAD